MIPMRTLQAEEAELLGLDASSRAVLISPGGVAMIMDKRDAD